MNIDSVKRLPISTDEEAYHVLMAIRRHLCRWDGTICRGGFSISYDAVSVTVVIDLNRSIMDLPFRSSGSDLRMVVMSILRQIDTALETEYRM